MIKILKLLVVTAGVIFLATDAFSHGTKNSGLNELDVSDPTQILLVTGETVPDLEVVVKSASGGGWDFLLTLDNFQILEGDSRAEVNGYAGHVNLFLDGEFSTRTDEATVHVDLAENFVHDVAIGLVSSDGRFLVSDGRLLMERFIILDPRSNPDENFHTSIIDVAVVDGEDAETVQVSRGDFVVLRWSVDAEVVLHLHGFDLEATFAPSIPSAMLFFAEFAGRFPVEAHNDAVERPVLFLEVLP